MKPLVHRDRDLALSFRYLFNKSLIIKPFTIGGWLREGTQPRSGLANMKFRCGFDASWSTPIGFSLQTTYARRIGENPNPLTNRTDQDGSLKKTDGGLYLLEAFNFSLSLSNLRQGEKKFKFVN